MVAIFSFNFQQESEQVNVEQLTEEPVVENIYYWPRHTSASKMREIYYVIIE